VSKVILYPDVQFEGEPSIEAAIAGTAYSLRVSRGGDLSSFSPEDFANAVALVCYHEIAITRELLNRLPNLKVVVRAGVGFDNIDIEAAGALGVAVCNTPDYGTTDVADHAIALTLALTRGVVRYNDLIRQDPSDGWNFRLGATVRRSSTLTFGIVGLGRIGTATALRAKALGMRVLFYDPGLSTGTELALGLERAKSLQDLLAVSDVLSLHTPLNDTTRGMISRDAFSQIKPGAFVINTARGGVLDLGALHEALRDQKISAAALDVAEIEPLPASHPLMADWLANQHDLRERLIFTPHAAFYSPSSLIDLRSKSAKTAVNYLRNGWSPDSVNDRLLNRSLAAPKLQEGKAV